MFALENYYLLNLFGICTLTVALLVYLARFDPENPKTGAFQRMLLAGLAWAFFDLIIGHLARYHSPHAAHLAFRWLSILFLLYIPASCELILALIQPIGWRHRAALYGPFVVLYIAGIAVPEALSVATFLGPEGGAGGGPAVWNGVFKVYTFGLAAVLLLRLLRNALAENETVARREKLVLWAGGTVTLSGIVVAQVLRLMFGPGFPWMANAATAANMFAGFWVLTRYGRVLSTRALHRTMIHLAPYGMLRLDGSRIAWANPAMARLVGEAAPEALVGRSLPELFDESADTAALADRIIAGRAMDAAAVVRRRDGAPARCLVASRRFSRDDRQRGALAVFTDVTALREMERAKRRLERRLARAGKMEALGLLAGGVAHDLNNVLSGIVSYPDLLLLDLPADSPLRGPIETIRGSGQKAADIVQDLLTLTRRGVRSHEPLALDELVRDYLASPEHRQLCREYPEVTVTLQPADDLPPIRGAASQLRIAIMNLVRNAAEAQPDGGRVTITTGRRVLDRPLTGFSEIPAGDYLVFQVADDGTGIPKEDLGRIFEPFYTRKVMGRSGTGLGMAVVWGTIQDHHGYIEVDSRPESGTRIGVYLPVDEAGVQHACPSDSPVERVVPGRGERVLVVDDEPAQREMALSILRRLGYRPEAVDSGEAAVSRFRQKPADVVLLDMLMEPGIDGLETYRRIRRLRPGQPAVIASGFSENDRVREVLRLGAGPYVRKPYTLDAMALALQRSLSACN